MERRFVSRFFSMKVWLFVGFLSLLVPVTHSIAFIGFKVGGVCFAACGSDSLLNRAASSIGSAFTDDSVKRFGDEGRSIVDYADTKAQQRLKDLSEMLDNQRKLSIRDLATQRQLFTSSLSSLVNTAANDLNKILTSALQALDQSLQDALDRLDATLRVNVGTIGVIFSASGGFLFALILFALYGFQKIFRRRKLTWADAVGGGIFVLACTSITGGGIVRYNAFRESQLVELWEQQISDALNKFEIAKAAAVARRVNSQWPSAAHGYAERKLAAIRDLLLTGEIWDSEVLPLRTAGVQAASLLNRNRIDADIMITLTYLRSKTNDALLMNDAIQKFLGNALLEPKTGDLGPYENGLRTLGCDLYRTIEVANTQTQAHARIVEWIKGNGDNHEKQEEYVSAAAQQFGVTKEYAKDVLSKERPIVPSCDIAGDDFRVDADRLTGEAKANDISSIREIAVLQHALQVRRQVILLDAAAGLWVSQCFLADICPWGEELEKRYAWLNGVMHAYYSRGVALTPPAKIIATLEFFDWFRQNKMSSSLNNDWYDKDHQPFWHPSSLIKDPGAKPATLCQQRVSEFNYWYECNEYQFSFTISEQILDEMGNRPNSYLSRLVVDNVKDFSDARTGSVLSTLYELSYRKALADIAVAYNDAVELKLTWIDRERWGRLSWPLEWAGDHPQRELKSDEELVKLKPDSPLWGLVICQKPIEEDLREQVGNIKLVDGKIVGEFKIDIKCDNSGKLESIFDILATIGKRVEPAVVVSDKKAEKLNTVFGF
ncbi:TRIC cation channel family protein [Sinorhizobium fredii]|uniref:Hypothetical transmembrane protein n=1 Tax=Sinorhizobium fredii (strain HH103) TaxID=1117943 RepID=G9AAX7_SINF1|nr:TRIC cation channel family protein [Sinorhizobium fredii]CCE94757.1 hypothetical transmembrane protein [Sinorhizobium fredii HH103]